MTIIVTALFFGTYSIKSFGNPANMQTSQKEKAHVRKTRIIIKDITIEEPSVVVYIGGSKKSGQSILDQLPSVVSANVKNASAEIALAGMAQKIGIRNGNIVLSDFSPEHGGKTVFNGSIRYESTGNKKVDIEGRTWVSVDVESFKPAFGGKGKLALDGTRATYGTLSVARLSANAPFSIKGDDITLTAAEFAVEELKDSSVKKTPEIKNVKVRGNMAYSLKTAALSISPFSGSIPQTGEFSGSISALLKDPLTFRGSINTPSLDLSRVNETARPYLPADYRNWSVQGKAAARTDFEGSYSRKSFFIKGRHRVSVKGGGLGSLDGTKAAQGVQADADITFDYASAPERLSFSLNSSLTGGEFLWGTYYRDFSGNTIHADARGNFLLERERSFSFSASTDLFGTGSYKVEGSGEKGEQKFSIDAADISLQKLNKLFLEDYLKQDFPSLAGATIDGSTTMKVNVRRKSPQTDLTGVITADVRSLTIPQQKISISGLSLNLPFDLGYPKASPPGKVQKGLIEIASAEKDRIRSRNIHIPLFLSGNRLRLPENAAIHIARGDIYISNFAADDILSPDRKISFSLKLDNVSLRPIQRSFTITPITGTISADYPRIEYYRDALTAGGSTQIEVFGGEIEIGIISIERLSKASRKIDTNISFKNINLEKATEQIAIGKMTGILQGSLSGLEIEYGQPTRFVLDIDSVDTRGISQRISVEAIQSISILGTGSGMSGALNRGILSFFKDYPYSAIGIHAALLNDNFTIRGKIHSGGIEYLVKRGFLRGVDVVNQNPDNKISFRDMQERLKRIFEDRKAGGGAVVQ